MSGFQEEQNMKKLLICCLFGNTANALAKKMQSLAEQEGYPLMISAVGLDNFASVAPLSTVFLSRRTFSTNSTRYTQRWAIHVQSLSLRVFPTRLWTRRRC